MTKRIIALVLALILALSLCATASAETVTGSEKSAAVLLLRQMGILQGTTDGSLELNRNVTRAEAAKLIAEVKEGKFSDRMLDDYRNLANDIFVYSDVPADHWALPYIGYCQQRGIIAGYGKDSNGEDRFGPDDRVTANQLMAMALRALGYGKFEGDKWEEEVKTAASSLSTLKGIELNNNVILRLTVVSTVYQTLFTPVKAADGQTGETLAKQQGVEFISLSDYAGTFSINGVRLEEAFPTNAASAFPAAEVVAIETLSGSLCAVLAVNAGAGSVRIAYPDGKAETVTPDATASELKDSVGKFAYWNVSTKQLAVIEASAADKGTADLVKNATKLGSMSIGAGTTFIIRSVDGANESIKSYTGTASLPTIYDADYISYTAKDGKRYVYISRTEEPDDFTGSARVFLVDPGRCGEAISGKYKDPYFFTEGAMDAEVGEVKISKTLSETLSDIKPGLYFSNYFDDGLMTALDTETYYYNPISKNIFGEASDFKCAPVKGIEIDGSLINVGTNAGYQGSTGTGTSVPFWAENTAAKAFCFDMSGSEMKSWTCSIAELSSDDNAYVWGTVTTAGKIGNLYIIYGADSRWMEAYGWDF